MATGPSDWGYVGVQGYYQGMANQQNALQNAAQYNQGLAGLLGGMSSTNPYAGAQQQMGMQYYQPAYIASTNNTTIESLFQGVAQAPAKAKAKAKRLVERLRAEIDEWHGDVLCRAA